MRQRPEKMIKPITPEEIVEVKMTTIPDAIIEAANQLIVKYWNGYSSTFKLKELILEYKRIAGGDAATERTLIDNNWLDIEPTFRKVGWKVKYKSPDRDESFEPYFELKKK